MSQALPVGAIIAFAADDTTKLPSSNWALCDGAQFSKDTHADLFSMIGYSNGGSNDTFYIPDLRGQFIRGTGNGVPVPGTVLKPKTANPNFKLGLSFMPTDYHHVDDGAIGPLSRDMVYWNDSTDNKLAIGGGDSETRPVNVYFHYVIKVAAATSIPIGAMIPYAGSDAFSPDAPMWLPCDGYNYNKAQALYKPLYDVIGNRFTSINVSSKFQTPSLVGIFIRGVDTGTGRDPDADHREAAPDGTTGRAVGTLQKYGTSAAGFGVNIPHLPPNSSFAVYPTLGHDNLHDANRSSATAFSGGNSESRPKNASVQYFILNNPLSGAAQGDGFPIGGIVAIPGSGTPDPVLWVPADGSSVARAGKFAALWAIMSLTNPASTAWGTADDQSFNLPNLQGRCLRATDNTATTGGVTDPWGDPDRGSRGAAAAGGTTQGTGSVQTDATGPPRNGFSIPGLNYPTDVNANAAAAVGKVMSEYHPAGQEFNFTGGDDETQPTGVSVRFFVKYAAAAAPA